jgi:cell division protein FtsI (penicillin-binding protein 3)
LKAQIAGYRVAGKTSTAHKLEGGRYTNKYVSSFVGFAPASAPRLIVAVMIDEPSAGQHFGGAVAAPVFARITESALRALGVAPDAPLVPLQLARPEGAAAEMRTREAM